MWLYCAYWGFHQNPRIMCDSIAKTRFEHQIVEWSGKTRKQKRNLLALHNRGSKSIAKQLSVTIYCEPLRGKSISAVCFLMDFLVFLYKKSNKSYETIYKNNCV